MSLAIDSQSRIISLKSPLLLLVRAANVVKMGPASVSSHARHSLSSQVGGGPLFGAVILPAHVLPQAEPSNMPS